MKKGTLIAFCFSLAVTLLFYLFVFAGAGALASPVAFQPLLLIFGASFFVSLATALSFQLTPNTAEGMASEILEGGGHFAQALKLFFTKLFPFHWLVLLLIASGFVGLERGALFGGALNFAGQILWIGLRKNTFTRMEILKVPAATANGLKWLAHGFDALALLSLVLLVDFLGHFAAVEDKPKAILLAAGTSLGLVLAQGKWRELKLGLLVHSLLLWCWLAPPVLLFNFIFDFRTPTKRHVVAFRDCPDKQNQFFTNANVQIPKDADPALFEGCDFFHEITSPALDDKMETLHHPGAFGISWIKTLPVPKL